MARAVGMASHEVEEDNLENVENKGAMHIQLTISSNYYRHRTISCDGKRLMTINADFLVSPVIWSTLYPHVNITFSTAFHVAA